ncbi:PREDICTED: heterogeneous nuclear ribonucleoprotein F-like isoform X1 [Ipomoea nil]|uniref:heterogeneous nuclear ribonucleoprotein F-like isoform X1 n=1 Tax=Ipomoea nil TaxID=35883 RepID=UPI00090146AB|nr:PREDICTED: heterogeneous nuclear ribonucleoprotein F-like isoform X1 [Ipomoea nil]
MYNRGRYFDAGDAREMGLKRQRIMDQGPSYYSTPPGPTYMYNPPPPLPPPPAPPTDFSYIGQPPPFPVVRLRGLPFGCTEGEIVEFLHGLDVVDVLLVHKGGKFTGEAYCVLGYPLQVDFALQRNRQNIGRRYVEVFRSKKQEYYRAIANELSDSRGGSTARARSSEDGKDLAEHTGVLRLRGLPFSAKKEDIVDFFKDSVLAENSIHITAHSEGRPTGEAFVEFANAEDSRAAMAKDRMKIGNRYIELFPSSHEELEEATSKCRVLDKPSDENDETEVATGVLRMRGLPFSAGKDDIIEFFKDFVLSEETVHITYNYEGRPTGEAFVEFACPEDAKAAMAKDRMTLGRRYIELFQSSPEDMNDALSRGR